MTPTCFVATRRPSGEVRRSNVDTRANILEAARELFTTRGYAATSPRTVMDRANVGQGSFYHHFRTKQQLAAEVLEGVCNDLLGVGASQLASDGSAHERLLAYLCAERDATQGCRLGRLAYDRGLEEEELRAPTVRYFKEVELLLISVFAELPRGGSASPTSQARDLAASALAVIQGGYVLALVHRDPEYLARAVKGFVSMLPGIEEPGA